MAIFSRDRRRTRHSMAATRSGTVGIGAGGSNRQPRPPFGGVQGVVPVVPMVGRPR